MGSTVEEGGESEESNAAAVDPESLNLEELGQPAVAEAENASPLEERFRSDIDTLLEENLEFWMKFSSSLQRVHEFQNKYEDARSAMTTDVTESGKGEAASVSAEAEKQLRALKTELQVWSEQNAMLRGELQCRFTSLCGIQEEITAALETEGAQFTSYQAAKFQGEVLNMQQENNRVSDELQAGLDHVKGLQAEIEKLHKSVVSLSPEPKDGGGAAPLARVPSKSKVPLQSFLFPAKNKKTSLFARVTPAVLQKQQAELRFLAKLPR